MKYRYDFGEKLDLSRFKKQAPFYISTQREVTFELYLYDFRVVVEVATPDNQNGHVAKLYIQDIQRDEDGELIRAYAIYPLNDSRLKEFKEFKALFVEGAAYTEILSNSAFNTVENICEVVRIIHKINGLLAFL